jgi:hypothetical protein
MLSATGSALIFYFEKSTNLQASAHDYHHTSTSADPIDSTKEQHAAFFNL